MMLKEHDTVALTEDLPAEGLQRGDVGAIVHCYAGQKAYEIEFVDTRGRKHRVATVEASRFMKLNLLSLSA